MPGDKDCKEGDKAVRAGKPRCPPSALLPRVRSLPGKTLEGAPLSALQRAGSTEPGWSWLNFTCRASPLDSALPYGIPGGKRVVAAWALSARRFALPSLPKAARFLLAARSRGTPRRTKKEPSPIRYGRRLPGPPSSRGAEVALQDIPLQQRSERPGAAFRSSESGIRVDPHAPALRGI